MKDTHKFDQHTDTSTNQLTEVELVAAMKNLGIRRIGLIGDDRSIIMD